MRIESDQNPRIKRLKSLRDRKGRKKERAFVIEGEKLLQEAVRDIPHLIREVYHSDRSFLNVEWDGPTFSVSSTLFASITTQKSPQGVLAVVEIPPEEPIAFHDAVLIADRMADPGNVGTMIRTAEAFGFQLCLTEGSADPYNPKVVQSSMGSLLRHQPVQVTYEDIERLHQTHRLIACALEDSVSLSDIAPSRRVAYIIGNESQGISKSLLELADDRVFIPMTGHTESLNAAVAGAIVMYRHFEMTRS